MFNFHPDIVPKHFSEPKQRASERLTCILCLICAATFHLQHWKVKQHVRHLGCCRAEALKRNNWMSVCWIHTFNIGLDLERLWAHNRLNPGPTEQNSNSLNSRGPGLDLMEVTSYVIYVAPSWRTPVPKCSRVHLLFSPMWLWPPSHQSTLDLWCFLSWWQVSSYGFWSLELSWIPGAQSPHPAARWINETRHPCIGLQDITNSKQSRTNQVKKAQTLYQGKEQDKARHRAEGKRQGNQEKWKWMDRLYWQP